MQQQRGVSDDLEHPVPHGVNGSRHLLHASGVDLHVVDDFSRGCVLAAGGTQRQRLAVDCGGQSS